MSSCRFGLYLVSTSSTNRQNISPISGWHLGNFPRWSIQLKLCLNQRWNRSRFLTTSASTGLNKSGRTEPTGLPITTGRTVTSRFTSNDGSNGRQGPDQTGRSPISVPSLLDSDISHSQLSTEVHYALQWVEKLFVHLRSGLLLRFCKDKTIQTTNIDRIYSMKVIDNLDI
jgi:hypothetical protein